MSYNQISSKILKEGLLNLHVTLIILEQDHQNLEGKDLILVLVIEMQHNLMVPSRLVRQLTLGHDQQTNLPRTITLQMRIVKHHFNLKKHHLKAKFITMNSIMVIISKKISLKTLSSTRISLSRTITNSQKFKKMNQICNFMTIINRVRILTTINRVQVLTTINQVQVFTTINQVHTLMTIINIKSQYNLWRIMTNIQLGLWINSSTLYQKYQQVLSIMIIVLLISITSQLKMKRRTPYQYPETFLKFLIKKKIRQS